MHGHMDRQTEAGYFIVPLPGFFEPMGGEREKERERERQRERERDAVNCKGFHSPAFYWNTSAIISGRQLATETLNSLTRQTVF